MMANSITSTAAAVEDEKLQITTRVNDEHLKERKEYQNVDIPSCKVSTLLPSDPWLGEDRKINDFKSLSQQPELPFRKPHINAKRRLDFQKVVDQPDPVILQHASNGSVTTDSELTNNFERKSIASKLTASKDCSLDFERESLAGTLSCSSNSEITRVKTSGHICSTSTPSPGNPHTSPFSSTMAVSPLTKAFKAFHVHQPQLEQKNSPHSQCSPNPSPSFLLPSYSYPCLFTAHPLSTHCQPFNLEPPPRGKESKVMPSTSPSVCLDKISVTNSGTHFSEKTREQDLVHANVSHSGPVMTQGNRSTFASPTLGRTTLSTSVTSDSTTPSMQQSKSGNERTNSSLIQSMSMLHRHLSSNQTKATRTNGRNQQSSSVSGGRQKQPPMQTSTKPGQKNPQLSHRCPSKIHCTNCGHKIDLKAYIEKFEMTKDFPSDNTRKSNGKPAVSVNNCGLTIYDLERICDTSSSISTDEKQQRIQQILCNEKSLVDRLLVDGNTLQFSDITTAFPDTYHHPFHMPFFPHSDKLTRSFAPVLCDTAKEEFPHIEYWDKLDFLDVNEMLELLESAPNTKRGSTCTGSQGDTAQREVSLSVVSLREKGDAKLVEPVQPANHIASEPAAVVSSDEVPYSTNGSEISNAHHCECDPKTTPDKASDPVDNSSIDGHVTGCVDTGDSGEVSKRRVLRSRVKQHCRLRICKHKPRKTSKNSKRAY